MKYPDTEFVADGESMKCSDLEMSAAFTGFSSDPKSACLLVQSYGHSNCGCPKPESNVVGSNACTVCADGQSVIDSNMDLGDGITCGLMEMMAQSAVDSDVVTCSALQAEAFVEGCCSAMPQPVANGCNVCGRSTVIGSASWSDEGKEYSCEKVAQGFLAVDSSSDDCSEMQELMREDGNCCAGEFHLRKRQV